MDTRQSPLTAFEPCQRLAGTRHVLLIAALYMGLPQSQAATVPALKNSVRVVRMPASAAILPVVRAIALGQGRVVETFDALDSFERGLVQEGQPPSTKFEFTPPGDKYLLVGNLVGPEPVDLTERYPEHPIKRALVEDARPHFEWTATFRDVTSGPNRGY